MTWEEVRTGLSGELSRSGSEKSDAKSLIELSKRAEMAGLLPETFTAPGINHLRTTIVKLRNAAFWNDMALFSSILVAAKDMKLTDLRLHLGKKTEKVTVNQMGDVVVAMFTKAQYEKIAFRNRANFSFVTQ